MITNADHIHDADCIIFDCDGVLVDVSDSYTATIIKTVDTILGMLQYRDMPAATPQIIQAFKDTGGFNNEMDLAYGIIVSMAAGRMAGREPCDTAMEASKCTNIEDIESMAMAICDVSKLLEQLAYPGNTSMVSRAFEQIFYGPKLYRMATGRTSTMQDAGLIEKDHILINNTLAGWLRHKFGRRIAMVTGRGRIPASHTLGNMMSLFDMGASIFLEDEPRQMSKPNPISLELSMMAMESGHAVYVGDSAEDMIMARRAGGRVSFVGIYGTASDCQSRRRLFEAGGTRHVIRHIGDLPKLLNSGRQ